jgi:hypothetical protein
MAFKGSPISFGKPHLKKLPGVSWATAKLEMMGYYGSKCLAGMVGVCDRIP